jgi:hypothetical protein
MILKKEEKLFEKIFFYPPGTIRPEGITATIGIYFLPGLDTRTKYPPTKSILFLEKKNILCLII